MSIDLLVEEARDSDRSGYAASTLREMLHGKRTLQLRAMLAFARALDVDLSEHEEYRLRLVRYLTDESIHRDLDVVLSNLASLRISNPPVLTEKQIREIPISHRQTKDEMASKGRAQARTTKRRTSSR
jgi:hypothetical protein